MSVYGNGIFELRSINEGRIFNKIKEIFNKKLKNKSKKEEQKSFCTEEEYNEYIEPVIKKVFNEYGKVINKVIKDNNASKYASFIQYNDEAKYFVCKYGSVNIFDFDIFDYANSINANARELMYEDLQKKGAFFDLIKQIKSQLPSVDGVTFIDVDEGGDWDDWAVSSIKFSKNLFKKK